MIPDQEEIDIKKYDCGFCAKTFEEKKLLYRHMRSKHGGVKHFCKDCDYVTRLKSHLNRHIQCIHEDVNYFCNECDYIASRLDSLRGHQIKKHNSKRMPPSNYNLKQKQKNRKESYTVTKNPTSYVHECEHCDMTFKNRRLLKKHMKSKHDGIILYCSNCEFSTSCKRSLKRHIESIHENIRLCCQNCDYDASNYISIKNHLINKHKAKSWKQLHQYVKRKL